MTIHELLKLLTGQTLTAENAATILKEVDTIKEKAVKAEVEKLNAYKAEHTNSLKELETYRATQAETKTKEAFVKAGGDINKYENFKKYAGKVEDIEKYDFKALFEDIPTLKGNTKTGGTEVPPKPNTNEPNSIQAMLALAAGVKTPADEPNETDVKVYG